MSRRKHGLYMQLGRKRYLNPNQNELDLFTGINLTSSSTWRGIKLKVAVAKPGYETRFVNAAFSDKSHGSAHANSPLVTVTTGSRPRLYLLF